mgnify:FL=1
MHSYRKEKEMNQIAKNKNKRSFFITAFALCAMATLAMTCPVFAADYTSNIKSILDKMIDVVGTIFSAVGIILGVYSVGSLIMAFKNEDADSKSRASTMLIVSIVLIAFPQIVKSLNLTSYLS